MAEQNLGQKIADVLVEHFGKKKACEGIDFSKKETIINDSVFQLSLKRLVNRFITLSKQNTTTKEENEMDSVMGRAETQQTVSNMTKRFLSFNHEDVEAWLASLEKDPDAVRNLQELNNSIRETTQNIENATFRVKHHGHWRQKR